MATRNLLLLFLFLLLGLHFAAGDVKAAYWFPDGGLPASSIDSTLFTHLFCAFADLDPVSNKVTISSSNTAAFTATVRRKNPSVTTLLSIGGGGANRTVFASMARQPSFRKSFIDSSIQLARANGFLGLDLDWEYPDTDTDMANLGSLLSEWRSAVNRESDDPFLLTAAFYVSSSLNDLTYPVDSISGNLDWVNVMAYDFYSPDWKLTTSAHAALYDPAGGVSGSGGIEDWIGAGLGGDKIVLGLPFYGYAWRLTQPGNHGLGAPATGPAKGTGIDPKDGSVSYNNIKAFISSSRATTVYNGTVVVNYCYSGTTWIGYDDVQAVAAKVKYAKGMGLLGYFGWSVSADRIGRFPNKLHQHGDHYPTSINICAPKSDFPHPWVYFHNRIYPWYGVVIT